MLDNSREKAIDKVRKLLALAGSSNEHEASLAADKAHAILAEYNLSLVDVETKDISSATPVFIIDNEVVMDSWPWRRQIAAGVAQLYFCTYYYTMFHQDGKRLDMHNFVGEQHNTEVAKMMFRYLVDTVVRLANESAAENKVPTKERITYTRAFQWGCTGRLGARLRDRIKTAKEGTANAFHDQNRLTMQRPAQTGVSSAPTGPKTNLPALMSLYQQTEQRLKSFVKQEVGNLRSSSRGGRTSSDAGTQAGREAGDRISLDGQIGGGRNAAQLTKQ